MKPTEVWKGREKPAAYIPWKETDSWIEVGDRQAKFVDGRLWIRPADKVIKRV